MKNHSEQTLLGIGKLIHFEIEVVEQAGDNSEGEITTSSNLHYKDAQEPSHYGHIGETV